MIDLQAGQNWQIEIPEAIRESKTFIACLSRQSVIKEGYVQAELRLALSTTLNRLAKTLTLFH